MSAGTASQWQENILDIAQNTDATGAKADAAVTDPASSGSEIALLKGIMTILTQGANAGAAGNVSAALGGFVDGAIATLGLKADAAWSGSGSGSGIAILKKIVALLSGTLAANVTEANSASILADLVTLAALSKTENAPWSQGDVGVPLLGARNDAFASLTTGDGKYSFFQLDQFGRLLTLCYGIIDHTSGNSLNNPYGIIEIVAKNTTPISAGAASDTIIKASAGTLAQVLVTATGTNAMLIYDNASGHTGTIIGAIPANPTVGSIYAFRNPASNGITVKGDANNPGITVSWS